MVSSSFILVATAQIGRDQLHVALGVDPLHNTGRLCLINDDVHEPALRLAVYALPEARIKLVHILRDLLRGLLLHLLQKHGLLKLE